MMAGPRFFIVAGEPSGDLLGGALMSGLRSLSAEAPDFEGVGGPSMAEEGLASRFPMEELSVMGLAEVLPRAPNLLRRIRETAEAVVAMRPNALITIDSPDFCLRVARRARAKLLDLKVIHYVAPSVWAWRPGRAAKMARCVDHVLALLPFEPPLMQAAGMSCDFVGHPVVAERRADDAEVSAIHREFGVAPTQRLLAVLPGSRADEVARLAPVFAEVARALRQRHPDLAVVVPAAAPVAKLVASLMPPDSDGWPKHLVPSGGADDATRKRAMFRAADAALAASGTVSLELAAAGTPMVIAYRLSGLTGVIARRVLRIDTVTLVNLITESRAVPEFLQEECTPERIAPAVEALLFNPEASAAQRAAGTAAMAALGRGGEAPGLRAARSVLDVIRRR